MGLLAQTHDALQDLLIATQEGTEPSNMPQVAETQEPAQEASQGPAEALKSAGVAEVEARAPGEQGLAGGVGELRDSYAARVAELGTRVRIRQVAFEAFCQERWGIAAEVAPLGLRAAAGACLRGGGGDPA